MPVQSQRFLDFSKSQYMTHKSYDKKYTDGEVQGVHNILCFSKILQYIPDSVLSRFSLAVSKCIQWQVKHQCCNRTCRVKKNHNIFRKKHNI